MNFDIDQIHLDDNSVEAEVMDDMIRREQATVEDVFRMALRRMKLENWRN